MAKIVVYNGGTGSLCTCTKPTELIYGKKYEVVAECRSGWQTDYILKEVRGHFNAAWFNEINSIPTYIAVSYTIPTIGQKCNCYRLEFSEGRINTVPFETPIAKNVDTIGNNIYCIKTLNSIYIVLVNSQS